MITGDKAETAVAISKQCSLLTEDHDLEKVFL
jgi:magnesium-transporting ATPase (P-type)